MRQVVLDTETTGLEPADGHRVIEIGALEMFDRQLTGRKFHTYLNPQRSVEAGALAVHGITDEFLSDKPLFGEIFGELLEFISDCELIIHNAPFDLSFLNQEIQLATGEPGQIERRAEIIDSLELARSMHPGLRNSLDALCKRYEVDNSRRNLHGALLDAQILAEVYLRMTGGQTTLTLEMRTEAAAAAAVQRSGPAARPPLLLRRADEAELAAHRERLQQIDRQCGGHCVWLKIRRSSRQGSLARVVNNQ